jgi:putative Ca2+/H+ antiporter (TMEM165/GDT1 family)
MFVITVFVITFSFIALMEIGDKTQLVVIALACKTGHMGRVAAGSTLGIAMVVVLGVALGTLLDLLIPIGLVRYGGAIIFFCLGLFLLAQTARHRNETEEGPPGRQVGTKGKGQHVFLGSVASVGLMEFGDKTQVATITLAATYDSPLSVALGAILAEGMLMIVGAFIGAKLLTRIRKDLVDYLSSALFIIAGLFMIFL